MRARYKRITYNPLVALQAMIPRSGLDHTESLTIAEVQATVLLKMVGVIRPPVPVPILAEYLDVGVECDPVASVVGYHTLRDGNWYAGYSDESPAARNATIAHQIKCILDDPFGDGLYPPVAVMATLLRKHHVAEYFAQCLTMPGPFVQQAWRRGERDVEQLAKLFGVPTASMLFRLKTLRLVETGHEL